MSIASIQTTMRKYWNTLIYRPKLLFSTLFAYFFVFSVDVAHAGIITSTLITLGTAAAVVVIPGLFMWGAVSLFDAALSYTVFEFYEKVQGEGAILKAIKQIWITTRDLANILIIGAFVYISISKILSLERDFRRQIVTLISVAILINFSFFFALTVIDLTNWLSVQIYNATIPTVSAPGESYGEIIVTNMQGVEMLTGMSEVFGKIGDTVKGFFTATGAVENAKMASIAYFFLSLVLTLVGALLFFRLAFILIARFVSLFIVLALSALAFSAMLIPSLNKYWVSWRNALVYNSIIAPILLFLLYVITKILEVIGINNIDSNNIELGSNFAETILVFFIGMGLLWGAIRVATILSNKAADGLGGLGRRINGFMNWTQGRAGAGVFAGAGWAGRNSLGRMGEWARGGLSSMADNTNNKILRRGLSSLATSSALNKIATSSYDARQNKATQKFMEQAGMSVGSGIRDGFKKIREDREKQDKKHDKNQYDGVIDAINAERAGYNATDTAKRNKEEELKTQERDIAEKKKQLAQQEKEHADKMVEEDRAEEAQKETIKQKEEALANIEEGKKVASRTVEESTAEMTAQTAEINRIEGQIQAKTQEMQVGLENGTLSINSPELQNIKTELENLNAKKAEHEQLRSQHQKKVQEARETLKSYPENKTRLEQEVTKERSALQGLESKHRESAELREEGMSKLQGEIQDLHDDRRRTTEEIKGYDQTLAAYRDKWNNMLAGTRMAQAAKALSADDRAWLAKNAEIEIDENGRITSAPTVAKLNAMTAEQREKMNKLLGQHAENAKFMAKILRDSSLSKKERQEQERNKSALELLANLRSGDLNISDLTKKPEKKEAESKE